MLEGYRQRAIEISHVARPEGLGLDPASLFPPELENLLISLHGELNEERLLLLAERRERQHAYDLGVTPKFEYDHIARLIDWVVEPIPADLMDRRVEITGPISVAKMVIQMLNPNSEGERACTAMLDFEDSMAPTWENVIAGLQNIRGVASKNLEVHQDGKSYRLNADNMAHPMVRVRGLHMEETHVRVGGEAISAGLFDLTCTVFHTARVFLKDGKTPKFYVPKCEHYREARWWNRLFRALEDHLGLKRSSLRVTFLIETLPASFQMEEILYEIRERACGLNGGRWDKIFSDIKTLRMHPDRVLADRSYIDMTRPWMANYAKLLVRICHRHRAFAMGGMAAFTPGKDEDTRKIQMEKVVADKKREAQIGHDGCWVSHPYFIKVAKSQFPTPNQLSVLPRDLDPEPDLLPEAEGPKTLQGLRQNIRVGIAYQEGWDRGLGCIAFENLMEDLATLEISRAQVWQWLHHRVVLDDGTPVTPQLVHRLFDEECDRILMDQGVSTSEQRQSFEKAKHKIRRVFLKENLTDFFHSAIRS